FTPVPFGVSRRVPDAITEASLPGDCVCIGVSFRGFGTVSGTLERRSTLRFHGGCFPAARFIEAHASAPIVLKSLPNSVVFLGGCTLDASSVPRCIFSPSGLRHTATGNVRRSGLSNCLCTPEIVERDLPTALWTR